MLESLFGGTSWIEVVLLPKVGGDRVSLNPGIVTVVLTIDRQNGVIVAVSG